MAELIWLSMLLAPFLLAWWMIHAQRRVRRQAAEELDQTPAARPAEDFAYEEVEQGADGLNYGHRHGGDVVPPDQWDGEGDGIRALNGRR